MASSITNPQLAPYASPDNPLAGRYVLDREVGRGGMAVVILAQDLQHRRRVAVKVLRHELWTELESERFLREIHIAAGLMHPNILPVHDSGTVDGLLYYVMPYVEGESLAARIAREGPLPIDEVGRLTGQIAAALDHAHSKGIIHRDIKPANVLLPGGVAVVADFGLARALEGDSGGRLTIVGVSVGTPVYFSPEQALGEATVGAASDQYSLACLVFEMLTGRPPFNAKSVSALYTAHLSVPAPRASDLRADIPAEVDGVLQRALSKAPKDRFASVTEFAAALDAAIRGVRTARSASSWRAFVTSPAGVAVAGLAAVGVAAWLSSRAVTSRDVDLDDNMVVVAPFEILGAEPLRVWGEGLMDILSRTLDGAGPLRSVSPTLVVRAWNGRADRASAVALGRSTGAGLAIAGQVIGAGTDSVRVTASIYDVRGDTALSADIEIHELASRMDRLSDLIAVRMLREMGRARRLVAVPNTSLRSRGLPALKAFLTGEQLYRRNDFENARTHFEQAIALDSTFALAHRRMSGVLAWSGTENSAARNAHRKWAGDLNQGLGQRDSLLVLADSLDIVRPPVNQFIEPSGLVPVARKFAALDRATRAYASDPEVWTALGEAIMHSHRGGRFADQALSAFENAIRADSLFGPAYVHAVELALVFRGRDSARALGRRFLRISPSNAPMSAIMEVLDGDRSDESFTKLLGRSPQAFGRVAFAMAKWPDEGDAGVRMFRLLAGREDDLMLTAAALRFRGRMQEAMALPDENLRFAPQVISEASLYAVSSADLRLVLDSLSRKWVNDGTLALLPVAAHAAAGRKDTAFLSRLRTVAVERVRTERVPADRNAWDLIGRVVGAYHALARNDSALAVLGFTEVPDSLGPVESMGPVILDAAQLFNRRGRFRDAIAILDRHVPPVFGVSGFAVLWALQRATAEAGIGNRERAAELLAYASAAWARADPPLRRTVEAVRGEMSRARPAN